MSEATADSGQMTLMEHLAELRMRLVRVALAVMIGIVIMIALWDPILTFLTGPYRSLCESHADGFCGDAYDRASDVVKLTILSPTEGLSTRFQISFYGGIVLALPVILWQVWRFVMPALHKHERKYALGFVLSSTILFIAGGFVAYMTLERALEFLIAWAGTNVSQEFQVSAYIHLVTFMVAAFGVGFTAPVFLVFLQLIGLVKWQVLLKGWRYAIVGTVILAAAITPSGDPWSLAALSVPMLVLYFVAVLIGWAVQRGRSDE
ncbi:MAG: twin-arginine translocase subunit TatC [Ilumatobacter coccineus]|uniref:Sec-independent protein translocase protein TatC n=1 Tax=Ilumatobacter coccineus TaxID=467094 RepID=A0A2G6K7N9_9ACTN|nr:MAG: twin-arginine translocase subunit TatC [Ilumatobacter coccineus]